MTLVGASTLALQHQFQETFVFLARASGAVSAVANAGIAVLHRRR